MKIVYIGNTCEHVVRPLCDGMYSELGKDFTFIETQMLDQARAGIGCLETRDYIFNAVGKETEAKRLCDEADVVIYGAAPFEYVKDRIEQNKLTIYYSERLFKKGFIRYFYPKTFLKVRSKYVKPSKNSNIYMLCASSYAALDFNRINAFKNKTFKWGYQISVYEKDVDALLKSKNQDGLEFIWVGRLVKLKHCDHAIQVIKRLKDDGINAKLTIIGSGVEEDSLKALVKDLDLEDSVIFKGVCKIDETRAMMDKANIFLFTSDFKEGWGATLNECMNSACACVASHAAGSTNMLIKDGENGLVYKSGDVEQLYIKVKKLVKDKEYRESLAKKAYDTMYNEWNPSKSYKRLLCLIKNILEDKSLDLYESGPCSRALPIKQNWYK